MGSKIHPLMKYPKDLNVFLLGLISEVFVKLWAICFSSKVKKSTWNIGFNIIFIFLQFMTHLLFSFC